DHPSGHDVGGGCAERVTDLPASTFAFVLRGTRREPCASMSSSAILVTAAVVCSEGSIMWARMLGSGLRWPSERRALSISQSGKLPALSKTVRIALTLASATVIAMVSSALFTSSVVRADSISTVSASFEKTVSVDNGSSARAILLVDPFLGIGPFDQIVSANILLTTTATCSGSALVPTPAAGLIANVNTAVSYDLSGFNLSPSVVNFRVTDTCPSTCQGSSALSTFTQSQSASLKFGGIGG